MSVKKTIVERSGLKSAVMLQVTLALIVAGVSLMGCSEAASILALDTPKTITVSGGGIQGGGFWVTPRLTLSIGETSPLAATEPVTWVSGDNDIATVDAGGVVTGAAVGTVEITATAADGKTAACTVTVAPLLPVASVDFTQPHPGDDPDLGYWTFSLAFTKKGVLPYNDPSNIEALKAALATWQEYTRRIDPRPFYDKGTGMPVADDFAVYSSVGFGEYYLDNTSGKSIVLHRYRTELGDIAATWDSGPALKARKTVFLKNVADIEGMMATIAASPYYADTEQVPNPLRALYDAMAEWIDYSQEEAAVLPEILLDAYDTERGIGFIGSDSGWLYEYYFGYIPDFLDYVKDTEPFAKVKG